MTSSSCCSVRSRRQCGPRGIADAGVVVQLVGGLQQSGVVWPPVTVDHVGLGALHLVGVDVAAQGDHGVLAELVLRSAAATRFAGSAARGRAASASSWRARGWRTPAIAATDPGGGRACRRCSAASRPVIAAGPCRTTRSPPGSASVTGAMRGVSMATFSITTFVIGDPCRHGRMRSWSRPSVPVLRCRERIDGSARGRFGDDVAVGVPRSVARCSRVTCWSRRVVML